MSVASAPLDLPQDMQRSSSTGSTALTISKRAGHRRTLREVFVKNSSSGYVDVKVGNVTKLRAYHNLAQAVMIAGLQHKFEGMGFFGYMSSLIKDFPFYSAGQDEDITLTQSASVTQIDAYWADQPGNKVDDRTVPGDAYSLRDFLIENFSNASAISATANGIAIASEDMPTGLSIFENGNRVSPNQKFTVYCIAGNFPKATTSKVTRIHIFEDNTELFTSEDNSGLLADPDVENELAFNLQAPYMFVLPTPYVFKPNSKYTITADATYDGTHALAANSQQVFLIGIREITKGQ